LLYACPRLTQYQACLASPRKLHLLAWSEDAPGTIQPHIAALRRRNIGKSSSILLTYYHFPAVALVANPNAVFILCPKEGCLRDAAPNTVPPCPDLRVARQHLHLFRAQ
jgi:hypothetical protein